MSDQAIAKSFAEEEEVLAAVENNDSPITKDAANEDPTIQSEQAQNNTAVLENVVSVSEQRIPEDVLPNQDDTISVDKEDSNQTGENGDQVEDPTQNDTSVAEDLIQNDTSAAEELIQNDTSAVEELMQNDTSAAEDPDQEDLILDEEEAKKDATDIEKSDKPQPGYKIPKINFQACKAAWETCKSPGKDYLTLSQFEKACESIGLVSTDYEKRFKELDTNENGTLEWVEYLKVLVTK